MKTKTQIEKTRGLLLAKAGLTIPMVARKFKVTRQFAYFALSGERTSNKAREIADYVNEKIKG